MLSSEPTCFFFPFFSPPSFLFWRADSVRGRVYNIIRRASKECRAISRAQRGRRGDIVEVHLVPPRGIRKSHRTKLKDIRSARNVEMSSRYAGVFPSASRRNDLISCRCLWIFRYDVYCVVRILRLFADTKVAFVPGKQTRRRRPIRA